MIIKIRYVQLKSDSDSNSDSDHRETSDENDEDDAQIVSERENEAVIASDSEEEDIVQCDDFKRCQSRELINLYGDSYCLQFNI